LEVRLIEAQEEFSYKLNNEKENAREEEIGTGIKQAC
jgi:hypothetical protein